jgi:type I restriction enzyme M protein
MTLTNFVKSVQDIMRMDAGVDGDAQRISQLTWMLFLKIFDTKEQEEWSIEDDYEGKGPFVPEKYQWGNWAGIRKAERMSSDELMEFIEEMFKVLKAMTVDQHTDRRKVLVRDVFEDSNNYMKSGVLLWQVIDKINEIDFGNYDERHAFNDIYETILKDLQSAGNSGEYYTPRAVTDFIIDRLNPQIGDKIADFACGTGGFLISALEHMKASKENLTTEENETIKKSLHGIEKKPMPHLLCCTNMILHDIDFPDILHENSLSTNIRDYAEAKKFDVIAMNPPFGGTEEEGIKMNFPAEFRTSETADLFMTLILNRVKRYGRVGIVLPDGFLFGTDNAKVAIKKKLLEEFNLHTIVRLPQKVFAPYADVATNLLFFNAGERTSEVWFYEHPMPEGYKNYSKTKPIRFEEFKAEQAWWDKREENEYAWKVSIDEIVANGYNLDFKNPNKTSEVIEFTVSEILENINSSQKNIVELTNKIKELINESEIL